MIGDEPALPGVPQWTVALRTPGSAKAAGGADGTWPGTVVVVVVDATVVVVVVVATVVVVVVVVVVGGSVVVVVGGSVVVVVAGSDVETADDDCGAASPPVATTSVDNTVAIANVTVATAQRGGVGADVRDGELIVWGLAGWGAAAGRAAGVRRAPPAARSAAT